MTADIIHINTQRELQKLAEDIGVGHDWHEPDNQDVTARVFGKNFDNAGFWGLKHLADRETEARSRLWNPTNTSGESAIEDAERFVEMFVVLYKDDKAVAEVDLATLFAFACGTYSG